MRGTRGHSLVEVLVPGLVILAGFSGRGGAIGPGSSSHRGRLRAEAALGIMSRIELLRAEAGRSSADCAALTGRDSGGAGAAGVVDCHRDAGGPRGRGSGHVPIPEPRSPIRCGCSSDAPEPPRDGTRRGGGGRPAHGGGGGRRPRLASGAARSVGRIRGRSLSNQAFGERCGCSVRSSVISPHRPASW